MRHTAGILRKSVEDMSQVIMIIMRMITCVVHVLCMCSACAVHEKCMHCLILLKLMYLLHCTCIFVIIIIIIKNCTYNVHVQT